MYNNISVPLENTPEESAQKDQLHSTVYVTRFGLNFKTPTAVGDVGGKLEMDFLGLHVISFDTSCLFNF